jgi:hypothetical protein
MTHPFRRVVLSAMLLAALVVGCSKPGSDFVGKWVNTQDASEVLDISRNGDGFLIGANGQNLGATYKDGALQMDGMMGAVSLTYVKSTDTLLAPGVGGQGEYKRAH